MPSNDYPGFDRWSPHFLPRILKKKTKIYRSFWFTSQIVFAHKIFCSLRIQGQECEFLFLKDGLQMTLTLIFKIKTKITIRRPTMTPPTFIRVIFPKTPILFDDLVYCIFLAILCFKIRMFHIRESKGIKFHDLNFKWFTLLQCWETLKCN